MPDESSIPEGLKVERTSSGGWRFELPLPRSAKLATAVWVVLTTLMGGAGWFLEFSRQLDLSRWESRLGLGLWLFLTVLLPAAVGYYVRFGLDGLQAVELDAQGLTICRRIPPFRERRRHIPLSELSVIAVCSCLGCESLYVVTRYRGYEVGAEVDGELLRWLAERLNALRGERHA